MKKSKKSIWNLELIGGIFSVEKFEDGTERREEIDGKVVLELLAQIIKDRFKELAKKK